MVIHKTQDGDTVRLSELKLTKLDTGMHRVQITTETTLPDGSGRRPDIKPPLEIALKDFIDRPLRELIQLVL